MGIKDDSEALLAALTLGETGDDVGDPQSFPSEEVHRDHFSTWRIGRFNDAIKWLVQNGHIENDQALGSAPFEMASLTTTLKGRLMAESLERAAPSVERLNGDARTLLAYLHTGYLKVGGGFSWSLVFDRETVAETGLDAASLRFAGQRLVDKGFAKMVGIGRINLHANRRPCR